MVCSFQRQKKDLKIINASQKLSDKSSRKTKKYGQMKEGSEFPKKSIKSWLQDNDIKIYSTHKEKKSVVAERFIRT